MVTIKMFPASYGDCFLVSIKTTEKNINILVDGGLSDVYKVSLKSELKKLAKSGERLDLVINSHIDSDHIRGIIAFLEDNIKEKYIDIGDIWYNGLEQIATRYPLSENINIDTSDNDIIEDVIKKGYEDDFKNIENISATEGISLASLIEQGNFNHNIVSKGKAITSALQKIELSKDVNIKVIGPDYKKLEELEREWLYNLSVLEFRFSVPKSIRLLSSFEFIVSRIKNYYEKYKTEITAGSSLESYLSDLDEIDNSVVNNSSISFVLEVYNKKFLFLGDSVVRNLKECKIIEALIEEYREDSNFEVIKLPHHGSRYNVSKDFIRLFKAREYLISTDSTKFGHPDIDVLANLAMENKNTTFIFNYPVNQARIMDNEEWKRKYGYSIELGNGTDIIERSYDY